MNPIPFTDYPRTRWLCTLFFVLGLLALEQQPVTAQIIVPAPPRAATASDATPVVARLYFGQQADLNRLATQYDLWEVVRAPNAADAYALVLLTQAELLTLRNQGYRVTVDAAQTAQLNSQRLIASNSLAGIPGYTCYRTVEETYASLAQLAATHPQLATWTDIGDSWEKATYGAEQGYDLYALKLTNSAIPGPKPKLLLIGAIHAREYTTAELATRFAETLVAQYGVDPDVTWLLDYTEIHLVPQTNPDGRKKAEAGQLWRKNVNSANGCAVPSLWGTDLNRNSTFRWNNGGSSPNACNIVYHGAGPASEPETQAIENYALALFPDQRGPNDTDAAPDESEGVFISLHSYGELVLFPWGYTSTPAPNVTGLQRLGRKFGYYNGYAVCTGPACLYNTSGTTDDFTYGTLGVASYTIELGQSFFEQCSVFESTILPRNLPVLRYAAKAARRPYQNPAGPDILAPTATLTTTATGPAFLIQATADDTRYNSNGWGIEASQPITAARLTIDAPSWITTTQPYSMTALDGAFNSAVEEIALAVDPSPWPSGRHLLFIEGQDSAGHWGVPTALFVELYRLYVPLVVQ
ncbi:MAG: hypothetical protein KF832_25835 [Caldilineaceae bacterium]|nr:hypothetical protein [Caldilineaceae bacterium]